jgi:hypothetical protein
MNKILHHCLQKQVINNWPRHIHMYIRQFKCLYSNNTEPFNVHGSVHRKYISIYIQQDATLHSLFIPGNCSTCFRWYLQPSSGAHTTVFTASGICHTVTATCCYRSNPSTIAGGRSNSVTNNRCCRYSCMHS